MKLSPAFIIQRLSDTYEIICSGPLSQEPCLDKLYFYTEESHLMENTLYLLDSLHMPPRKIPLPANSLALQIQNSPETPQTLPVNYCLLKNNSSILSLFNRIQELFQTFNQWQKDLMRACLNGEPVQRLLEISQPVLNISPELLDDDWPINASAPADENVSAADAFRTRLLALPDFEGRGFLLEYLAEMAQCAFSHNAMLHSLFHAVLTGQSASSASISQQLDALGWNPANHYLCIILENGRADGPSPALRPICRHIESALPYACAFIYKNNIVLYINQTKSRLSVSAISEKLAYFIRDQLLKAGYSRCMPGHLNFYEQYVQGCAALEIGKRKHPSLWIHHFEEIALDYILNEATKKLPAYMISHEKLLKLKNIDDLHHTEYVKTLRCYLNNHCNAVQTAKALYIHRSTFLYRLDKIKTILHVNLNNPDETLYLMLSLRFIEMENASYAFTSTPS